MNCEKVLKQNHEYLQNQYDNAESNYKRIETLLSKTREELNKLEKQLLIAEGRKEATYKILLEAPYLDSVNAKTTKE